MQGWYASKIRPLELTYRPIPSSGLFFFQLFVRLFAVGFSEQRPESNLQRLVKESSQVTRRLKDMMGPLSIS